MIATLPRYCGRLAPSPTGRLHLGHARTFWIAAERARAAGGSLRLRNDDLDFARCRPEFVDAMQEDLRWLGLNWEGEMVSQSQRIPFYQSALQRLHQRRLIFPCTRSRRDVAEAAGAPHEGGGISDDEPVYPVQFRPPMDAPLPDLEFPTRVNWRFRVPDGRELRFVDFNLGEQTAVAGRDFGDFLVWRKDGVPSYQLACAADDADMKITEVVRGADLIRSTFRQMLLAEALGYPIPAFYHCDLVTDERGVRLAKRHDALSLKSLRESGLSPADVIQRFTPLP